MDDVVNNLFFFIIILLFLVDRDIHEFVCRLQSNVFDATSLSQTNHVVDGLRSVGVLQYNLVSLSTGLIMWIGHRKEIRKLTFRALSLRRSQSRGTLKCTTWWHFSCVASWLFRITWCSLTKCLSSRGKLTVVFVCHRTVGMAAVYQLKIKYDQDKFGVVF